MDRVPTAPNDDAAGCFEAQNAKLQQLRDYQNKGPDVESASSLIRKLQRTVAERCADLSRTRDALHLAQHQASSLQGEIRSIEANLQQQQIDQLERIRVAKSRLLQICDVDDTLYDKTMTPTIVSTDDSRSHQRESHNVSRTDTTCGDFCIHNGVSFSSFHASVSQEKQSLTPLVGPVVLGRPIGAPVGPVRSRHRQLDTVRSENTISSEDNSEQDKYVKILDINPDGKYVRLRNTSINQNYNLGQCRLQQNIAGHPVAIFRFPPETALRSQDTVTVWAEGCLPTTGTSDPTDLIFRGLQKWGAGPHFTTLLFSHRGQILSQWSAVHRQSATIPFKSTIQLPKPPDGRAVSQLRRPYSSASLPSRLQKVWTN